MSLAVVYYSLTGNNKALAAAVARELSAELVEITEGKPRNNGTIAFDILFNRIPEVRPLPPELGKYDKLLFIAPVWMGRAAFPLRAYFRHLKTHPQPYAFASISGGGLNPNPQLRKNIEKAAGSKPFALVDLHIADLLPQDKKVTAKDTGAYRLSAREAERLARAAADAVRSAGEI